MRLAAPPRLTLACVCVCVPGGSLEGNGFGSEGAKHLAEALKQNTSLTELR